MFIKIIILGIAVCVINIILSKYQMSFSMPINIVYIILVTLLILDNFTDAIKSTSNLLSVSGTLSKTITCIYKCAAVCILSKISVDLCKESGNTVVSDMIDIGGRIMVLSIAMPFINTIIKTAASFVK